jgi:hypothetical protein
VTASSVTFQGPVAIVEKMLFEELGWIGLACSHASRSGLLKALQRLLL